MRLKVATLSYGFVCLSLMKCCQPRRSKVCDDGKTTLETDLPQPEELACPGPWPRSSSKPPDISTNYPLQPAERVCMDMPITYNHTIPSSGAHRPIGAKSGEYLYCPPQRWLNNLKDGAIVLLYHPCVSEAARRSLAAVANSCLPHYILTAHPQLGQQRPFAVVSWGRTLEMSHITTAGVCPWLQTASAVLKNIKGSQRPKYSLYMSKAASVDRALHATSRGSKSKLKSLSECCMEVLSTYEHTSTRSRRSRAVGQLPKKGFEQGDHVEPSESTLHNISESQTANGTRSERPTVAEEGVPPAADVHDKVTGVEDQDPSPNHAKDEAEQVSRSADPQTNGTSLREIPGHVGKHRVKTDVEEPIVGAGPVTPAGERPPPGQRMPTERTDEAVWAAAALGFLLVLLTLSVLHTRLYRNWRTPTSLYWREARQDYESMADIIRRRLKMVGRRKRKPSQSRRQECPLLPNSSTDNESD